VPSFVEADRQLSIVRSAGRAIVVEGRRQIIMRRFLIGLALVLVAMPVEAQIVTEKADANCSSDDVDVSISACTAILRSKTTMSDLFRLAAYYRRGLSYSKKGLQDRAIADFKNAIALKPAPETLVNLHGAIAMAYYREQHFAECIAVATQVIAMQPNGAAIGYRLRGTAYEFSEQPDKAIDDYRAALKFDPDSPNLKAALSRLGATP
jgi:tetratricopeptide (TPR) repeat protein